jgi:exodeoxyribonuclease VII large subunit
MNQTRLALGGPKEEPRRLSLVRLSAEIAQRIADVGLVAVEGEVYRPVRRPNGRLYFVLRDRSAQVNVSCPARHARLARVVGGERVLVTGRLAWLNDRGVVQLEATEVVPVGAGAVAAKIAEARERLRADGLLDRPRRPIPRLPAAIGVVCGAEAAVRRDIESVVADRFPGYPVRFVEVTVTGPAAVDNIIGALHQLDAAPEVEVIVLARGGGDATQLLPFSDEELCRAICACATPVVSAIGHDGDRPLCDEVADLRCGTPSIAAHQVVPDRAALAAEIDQWMAVARSAADRRLELAAGRLAAIDRRAALRSGLEVAGARLERARQALALSHPGRRLADARRHLDAHRARLEALDPARVLARGYAVVRTAAGAVVRDPATLHAGERLEVQVAAGRFGARVEGST